jgi:ArsR family transcriptional regulator, lead/cadmium/zinc/bismuth-responsive transcriptional repressor
MSKGKTMATACSELIIHPGAVGAARAAMPGPDELLAMGDYLKALGDQTRLKILSALERAELCVCDISAVLGLSVSAVSHQLALLRRRRLVRSRREGKVVFYSLSDRHVSDLIRSVREHLGE